MSLINDALKRAKAAQDKAPPAAAAIPHLRPVESAPGGRFGPGLVLPTVLTVVALGGLFLLWHAAPSNTQAARPAAQTSAPEPAGTPEVARSVPERRESSSPPGQPTAAAAAPAAQAAAAVTTNISAPVAPVAAKPALPRLQAIVYTPASPSAIISGKTVFIGDHIAGFQVAAITRHNAMLIGAGGTNLLSLEP